MLSRKSTNSVEMCHRQMHSALAAFVWAPHACVGFLQALQFPPSP